MISRSIGEAVATVEMLPLTIVRIRIERDATDRPYMALCSGIGCLFTADSSTLFHDPRTATGRGINKAVIVVLLPSCFLHAHCASPAASAGRIVDHIRAGCGTWCGGALRLR